MKKLIFYHKSGALRKNGPESSIKGVSKWTHNFVILSLFGNNGACSIISKKNAHISSFDAIRAESQDIFARVNADEGYYFL
jgi:hypothetical protein